MGLGRNFLWQFLGQGVAKGLGLLFYLLLPRLTGLEIYGQFTFALSLSLMILQPLLELGLDLVITKGVSRDRSQQHPVVIQDALLIRGGMAVLCLALLPLLARLGTPFTLLASLYLYLVLLSMQRLCFAVQRGYEQMRLEAVVTSLHKGLALVLLLGLGWATFPRLWLGPIALVVATAIATFITLLFTWPYLQPSVGQSVQIPRLKQTATEGVLLGGVALLGMLYFRIDSVMLGIIEGDAAVGLYNAAYRLVEGAIMLPSVIMIVAFPRLAQPQQFRAMFQKLLALLGGLGVLVSLAMVWAAPALMTLIYTADFQGAIPIMQLLSLCLLPIYLGHLATQSLVALERQKLYLLLTLAAVVVNIALNAGLIPLYGAQGAAIATLITESLIMLGCFAGVGRRWAKVLTDESKSVS
ncbi:MAG: oligosaccharide flippase family protein [Spirulinaceae cyanobacterium]